jgi:uncharacterized phiE125 gp8 family phage protein
VRYEQSSGPATEPVSAAEVAAAIQIGSIPTDQASHVTLLIESARRVVENRTRRQLVSAQWKLYLDSFPDLIEIRDHLPVSSVTSITYYDTSGVQQTLAASSYQVDCKSPNRPARIRPAYGQSWPSTYSVQNAITVMFQAGYSTVPACAKSAMLMLIAGWYAFREPVGSVGDKVAWGLDALLEPLETGIYD